MQRHDPSLFYQCWGDPSFNMALGEPGCKPCNIAQARTSIFTRSEPSLINVLEKRQIFLSGGGTSTHNLQSDAGHGPSQDIRQREFLRIGQWSTKITPEFATPSIALESHSAIRRTDTELLNEEISIDTARSRTRSDDQTSSEHQHEYGDVSQPHTTSPSEYLAVFEDRGPNSSDYYYQFESFRILIGMMLLMVSEVMIRVLAFKPPVMILWFHVLTSITIGLVSLLLYIGIFVVLMEYHEAVANFLNRYARLWPGLQRFCLRLCAYVYALGVIAGLGWWLFGLSVGRSRGVVGPFRISD